MAGLPPRQLAVGAAVARGGCDGELELRYRLLLGLLAACASGIPVAALAAGWFSFGPFGDHPEPAHHVRASTHASRAASAQPMPPTPAPVVDAADEKQARAIATDAYLYAYPLLLMELTRREQTNLAQPDVQLGFGAPINQFTHMSHAPDSMLHEIPYLDPNVLHSSMWFDVAKQPLVVEIPPSEGRYYFASIADMWTDVFAAPGTRTSGKSARILCIVGPNWKGTPPRNAELLHAPTAAGRLEVDIRIQGAGDLKAAREFQFALRATPLNLWNRKYQAPTGTVDMHLPTQPPVDQLAAMNAQDYLALYTRLAALYPAHDNDGPMLERLRRIGVEPGKAFDPRKLPPAVWQAIQDGVRDARAWIQSPPEPPAAAVGGWPMPLRPRGSYGTDYLLRARLARLTLVSPLTQDMIEVRANTDAEGRVLDGTFRYELRFERGQLPPASGFWSLTLYTDRGMLFDNALNRYALPSKDDMVVAPDGSTTLYVQYPAVTDDKKADWLPSPISGRFSLILRIYDPDRNAAEGSWMPPPIRRVR
jgi:hypothetical protein